jgi:hypothetical protein
VFALAARFARQRELGREKRARFRRTIMQPRPDLRRSRRGQRLVSGS